ncbi:MAG: hypothetical protein JSV24_12320 [Bacteroidales bacterium]|nr:MAG: hypothetical protein JSV24_12320 [Bacteroidales bacterium]
MKKLIVSIVVLFIACIPFVYAQEETGEKEEKKDEVQKSEDIQTIFQQRSGGHYAGFSFNYSEIDQRNGMQFGFRGGWIAGHGLAVGLGGKLFFNESDYDQLYITDKANLIGGYGGILVEPIILPRFPVHLSIPVLAGMGGIAYSFEEFEFDWENSFVEDSDFFLVIEPGVELEFNILRHFRIAIGAYYAFTSDIQLEYIDPPGGTIVGPNVLNGLSFGITMKLGRF